MKGPFNVLPRKIKPSLMSQLYSTTLAQHKQWFALHSSLKHCESCSVLSHASAKKRDITENVEHKRPIIMRIKKTATQDNYANSQTWMSISSFQFFQLFFLNFFIYQSLPGTEEWCKWCPPPPWEQWCQVTSSPAHSAHVVTAIQSGTFWGKHNVGWFLLSSIAAIEHPKSNTGRSVDGVRKDLQQQNKLVWFMSTNFNKKTKTNQKKTDQLQRTVDTMRVRHVEIVHLTELIWKTSSLQRTPGFRLRTNMLLK